MPRSARALGAPSRPPMPTGPTGGTDDDPTAGHVFGMTTQHTPSITYERATHRAKHLLLRAAMNHTFADEADSERHRERADATVVGAACCAAAFLIPDNPDALEATATFLYGAVTGPTAPRWTRCASSSALDFALTMAVESVEHLRSPEPISREMSEFQLRTHLLKAVQAHARSVQDRAEAVHPIESWSAPRSQLVDELRELAGNTETSEADIVTVARKHTQRTKALDLERSIESFRAEGFRLAMVWGATDWAHPWAPDSWLVGVEVLSAIRDGVADLDLLRDLALVCPYPRECGSTHHC